MQPSRPLEAKETSTTAPSRQQVMPSHSQQSVSFCHDTVRPLSCESPARNWRREAFSCSLHEEAGEAMESSSSRPRTRPLNGMAIKLLFPGNVVVVFASWTEK
ncbi:hypothetical protein GQ55_1G039800 [Panicum hallii var. hallii]|uniref:Uncharacterized protein n=1 Tax=Panicum hallii var. hallii TaxID=1504633 RepID=A0A2T7F225_9POAL|nr:hypothetical protein GQ55_1G039800 [Panicum hallii var. hallii]